MKTLHRFPSARLRRESGNMVVEFAFVALLFIPLFMGTFVTGMNMIRSIQANHVAGDLANMYIHGADFSDRALQTVAVKLARGMDLQTGSGTGNVADNLSNGGRGIVWVSKVMWVGDTNSANCQGVVPAACTNTNKFVVTEQIRFGNGNLESIRDTTIGHPTAPRDVNGRVTVDVVRTASAAIPEPQQTKFQQMWQVSNPSLGRAPLGDGQVLYVVEVFFRSPDLNIANGTSGGGGVYARWFY